jgi:PAS domain S-box-containing protein
MKNKKNIKAKKPIAKNSSSRKRPVGRQKARSRISPELRVLILEDNPADAELIERQLKKDGIDFTAQRTNTRGGFLRALKTFKPDLFLADYKLPKFNALQALALRKKIAPHTPFIIVTGSVSEEIAVECMKRGADDYVLKDRMARLGEAARHALEKRRLQAEITSAEESLRASEMLHHIFIDSSADMAFLKDESFRHILANRELCRFYGHSEKEIIGKTDFELMPRKVAQKCRKSDQLALVERRIHISEETVGDRTYETRKFPVKLIAGSIGVGGYIRDVSERISAEAERVKSESLLRTVLSNAPITIFAIDDRGIFTFSDGKGLKKVGLKPGENVGESALDLFHSISFVEVSGEVITGKEVIKRVMAGEMINAIDELRGVYFDNHIAPIHDSDGKVVGIVGVATDITERKKAEEQIRASLREKEVLLKEIHHRVKNNLQIISGLLTLQSAQINDERFQRMIKDSQSRIWTMALIHQTLYQSGNLADIDMADYIRSLSGNLLSSQARVAMPPNVVFDLQPLRLAIGKAIPLALIVNELLTNAMKHAFPDGRAGEIKISLRERRGTACRAPTKITDSTPKEVIAFAAPDYELTVTDDGVGLPAGFDPEAQKSLGLQLVAMLAKQIEGTLAFESKGGTSVVVLFKADEKSEKQS